MAVDVGGVEEAAVGEGALDEPHARAGAGRQGAVRTARVDLGGEDDGLHVDASGGRGARGAEGETERGERRAGQGGAAGGTVGHGVLLRGGVVRCRHAGRPARRPRAGGVPGRSDTPCQAPDLR